MEKKKEVKIGLLIVFSILFAMSLVESIYFVFSTKQFNTQIIFYIAIALLCGIGLAYAVYSIKILKNNRTTKFVPSKDIAESVTGVIFCLYIIIEKTRKFIFKKFDTFDYIIYILLIVAFIALMISLIMSYIEKRRK
ncbi:hypothetical protein [Miniphocaeibacter halophilus]|uniref:Uncharacterized protein n=1 Tax=Miniphocaeibacter halophilus TaxID=2931922 RepID=A0AC61MT37_9FIRM|nr:hypothetical protein [Miniphocaeibacter halophilus]QQK08855.1 hypothetical protein JFY71_04785 [Miniphocaeibacter halophilus]